MAKQRESKNPNELLGAIKAIKESLVNFEIGSPEYIQKLNELGEVQKAFEVLVPDPQKYTPEVSTVVTPVEKIETPEVSTVVTPVEKIETPEVSTVVTSVEKVDTPVTTTTVDISEEKDDDTQESPYDGLLKIDFSKIQKEGWDFLATMARREAFDRKFSERVNAEPEIELSKEEVKNLAKSNAQARIQANKEKQAELVAIQEAEAAKKKEKK